MIDAAEHLGLVWNVIRKHKYKPPAGMDKDDLFQIGCIGLIYAARKFDPSKNHKFSTYATFWIRSEISRMYKSIEVSKRTGVTVELDKPLNHKGYTLAHVIPDQTRFEEDVFVHELARKLIAKEPLIVKLLAQGYTQREIAKEMGVTHQRISQKIQKLRRVVV